MGEFNWGGFAENALNTSLGVWATREQAKLGIGVGAAPLQQAAVTGAPEVDNGVSREATQSGQPWYQRKSVKVLGGAVLAVGVLYVAYKSRGRK